MQNRYDRLIDFFRAGEAIGFSQFELSHIVTQQMFEGFNPGAWAVSSVHDPCPHPERPSNPGKPSRLSSTDPEARAAAGPYNKALLHSLELLVPYARKRDVRLGFETRVHYGEIPSFEEMGWLLDYFDDPTVGFWLDTGHAQVLANLGFHPLVDWLRAYSQRLIGVHFHDVRGLRDHLIPGMGGIDFSKVARFLPPEVVRTCEFDWYFTEDEIRRGVDCLREVGCA